MADFNIKEIFKSTFGFIPPPKVNIPDAPARKEFSKLGQPFYADDLYGREMFMPVRFIGAVQSGATVVPIDYLVPFAVVTISCKKTIISTPLVERKGTVKELVNAEDYAINIKGIIVRPDNEWPEEEVSTLEQMWAIDQSLQLRSALTDIFLKGEFEHRVVIRSISLPANPGVQNAKPFELDCESDQIFTLEVE